MPKRLTEVEICHHQSLRQVFHQSINCKLSAPNVLPYKALFTSFEKRKNVLVDASYWLLLFLRLLASYLARTKKRK